MARSRKSGIVREENDFRSCKMASKNFHHKESRVFFLSFILVIYSTYFLCLGEEVFVVLSTVASSFFDLQQKFVDLMTKFDPRVIFVSRVE